ncbi:histidine kinase [Actinoplanes sp. NPDC023714]|uniref:sensor histidine kinase n=1 Tax=Actinoplanes sp. NPDC023714 TaxID=3154322 RepID=UPI00340BB34B
MVILGLVVAVVAAVVLAVALRRARRRYDAAVGERGWLLERERESAAQSAADAERARIASELHDIVSHNVSVMIVQTSAAREVLRTMPDEALAALEAVEKAGRDTMTELRHLLGLLNPSSPEDDLGPQPTLDGLSALVDRIAFAGLPVEVRVSGEIRPLPSGISATAYRIVQEALTNALKHGSGGKAEVTIRYAPRALRVEVLTTGPSVLKESRVLTGSPSSPLSEGTGRGLLGLRERVAVYGGDLDARRRLGGGYRVRARIPHE